MNHPPRRTGCLATLRRIRARSHTTAPRVHPVSDNASHELSHESFVRLTFLMGQRFRQKASSETKFNCDHRGAILLPVAFHVKPRADAHSWSAVLAPRRKREARPSKQGRFPAGPVIHQCTGKMPVPPHAAYCGRIFAAISVLISPGNNVSLPPAARTLSVRTALPLHVSHHSTA